MRKLRDFASIAAFLSEREIDEIQAAIDARRGARAERAGSSAPPSETGPRAQRRGRAGSKPA